jgi:hypothetical protein
MGKSATLVDIVRIIAWAGVSANLLGMAFLGSAMGQEPTQNSPIGQATSGLAPKTISISTHFHEPDPIDFDEHAGFTSIFDSKTLKDWDGDPETWRVENGSIIGESTKDRPRSNSYISYHGTEAKDFDLKMEIKVENGGGSGIQYRSSVGKPWTHGLRPGTTLPKLAWMMTGPQADFWYPVSPRSFVYTGQFYSENTDLGILAWRGQVTESEPGKSQRLLGNIGNRDALGGYVKINDWNQYEIIARGGTFIHIINGQLMAVYIDDNPKSSNNVSGLIGIEVEGTPCKVSVRNLWLRKFN